MKVLILQIKGKSYGGVWQVNKMVGEALVNEGYDITILSIRENHNDYVPEYDHRMHVETLNPVDDWETYSWTEIIKTFPHKGTLTKLKNRLHNSVSMQNDKKKVIKYIRNLKPDYILSSHYQLLYMIPKEYLKISFNEQHRSFRDSWSHKATRNTFMKYKDKVTFIWLCKKTMEEAIKKGLTNSLYIYNAVRFTSDKIADVNKNKKLVTIARISPEKRINRMVDIAEELFKNSKYHDWTLEIWGDGEDYDSIKSLIKSRQIKLMGRTNNPKEVLLSSSINLNTSDYEGFALGILEANECGVPTITYNFGESTDEEILSGETGFIAKDKEDYLDKLRQLMDDEKLLKMMSKKCKEYNKNFQMKTIVNDWKKIFK